ncbi:glucose-1-phosphate adenylyltransferase [Candidatus Epulonipiscium viviparus]|uniref:glucose-1-phosphate adenylyltransferase n=1 Tax=Candidatus Epulonipiscium viviparus TaxID=420336 RepID=UPI00016C003C|nr:glucose-1-phosphate adenylyltransferase [Candidatus Epulopiscium viviparus]
MPKKEMIAMLLAGGQGSRLGVLTQQIAKPAVMFGGKYRIIDFPLSNCVNSGIDTVGVLTQYEPLMLTTHIGIGIPWDLDLNLSQGGIRVLSPFMTDGNKGAWYSGTANAIYQNIRYIDSYNPDYVLVLSGDHVYKMDYNEMLNYHKEKGAVATVAVIEVPYEEASQFGIMNTDESLKIVEFEEKPKEPKSNLASMGIYIFNWKELREALIADCDVHEDSDFGKHIMPSLLDGGAPIYAYPFKSYWRDIGTIEAYWQANMGLSYIMPEFNLYDAHWSIYTNSDNLAPQYISQTANIAHALISKGCTIEGDVQNSIISPNVQIEKGCVIKDSIIMQGTIVKSGAHLYRCIVSENSVIGENVTIGEGENIPNHNKPHVYNSGISVIGAYTNIPAGIWVGKNCEITGDTKYEDYEHNALQSGASLIIEGGLK